MHGGFENETPNIPTNTIMRLDLIQHVKGNQNLLAKLESAFQTQYKNGANPNNNGQPQKPTDDRGQRPLTPPI